jgi:hypothetical protein
LKREGYLLLEVTFIRRPQHQSHCTHRRAITSALRNGQVARIDLTSGTMRRAMEAACSAMARRTCGVPCLFQSRERVRSSRSTSKSAPKGKSELPRNVATRSPQATSRYQRSNRRHLARNQRDAPGSVQAWIPECRSWSSRRCYTPAACGGSD